MTIVVVVLVVAGGLTFNRHVWRPRQAAARAPRDGLKVWELVAPVASLAVVLLVFVLVQTFGSWAAAGRAETDEATATLLLFREADLLANPGTRETVREQVVCYATSVIHQDWPAMGRRRISNVPTYWGGLVRAAGVRLVRANGRSTAGESLVTRDAERTAARQRRLGEARPSVPLALQWLMLASVVVVLAVLGTTTMAGVDPRVHVVIVVAAAVVFASSLLLIRDLDQPYAGALRRSPTQTEFVRSQISEEVRTPLPCDAAGLPRRATGFRPSTEALG